MQRDDKINSILQNSIVRGFQSGMAGAQAMIINVICLMWVNTIVNYQQKQGTKLIDTIKLLQSEGGILRFQKGFFIAIIQGPILRFFDVAANTITINYFRKKTYSLYYTTLYSTILASLFRISLLPLDTLKTIQQVHGSKSLAIFQEKIKLKGIRSLWWHGSFLSIAVSGTAYYPWWLTQNYLNVKMKHFNSNSIEMARNGCIGVSSAVVSDICSNLFRALKTIRQSSVHTEFNLNQFKEEKSYTQTQIFLRGLPTRLIFSSLRSMLFCILYTKLDNKFN